MREITVSAVKPNMVDMLWPIVEPMIASAIDHSNGELDINAVKGRIIDGSLLLLTVSINNTVVSCLTLEIRNYETGKITLNVITVGGADISEWGDKIFEDVSKIAKIKKADEIYVIGRPGWQKLLKDKGFSVVHTVLSKKV